MCVWERQTDREREVYLCILSWLSLEFRSTGFSKAGVMVIAMCLLMVLGTKVHSVLEKQVLLTTHHFPRPDCLWCHPYSLQTKSDLEVQHTENFNELALSFLALPSRPLRVCPDLGYTSLEEDPEPSSAALLVLLLISAEDAHSPTLHLRKKKVIFLQMWRFKIHAKGTRWFSVRQGWPLWPAELRDRIQETTKLLFYQWKVRYLKNLFDLIFLD